MPTSHTQSRVRGAARWGAAIAGSLFLGTLMASSSAWADPGPSIDHQPIASVPLRKPLEVTARIVSNSSGDIYKPTLYLRANGVQSFSRIELKLVPDVPGLYTATIPAALVSGPFDYYLEASDTEGNGPTRLGAVEAPLHVQISGEAPAPAPTAPVAAPTVAPAPVTSAPTATVTPLVVMQGPPPSESASPVAAYATSGGGAVAAIGGAVLLGVGNSSLNSWIIDSNHLVGAKALTSSQISSEHQTADAELTAGACLVGAGVVAAGVGVYLYLSSSSAPEKKAEREEAARHPTVAALLMDF